MPGHRTPGGAIPKRENTAAPKSDSGGRFGRSSSMRLVGYINVSDFNSSIPKQDSGRVDPRLLATMPGVYIKCYFCGDHISALPDYTALDFDYGEFQNFEGSSTPESEGSNSPTDRKSLGSPSRRRTMSCNSGLPEWARFDDAPKRRSNSDLSRPHFHLNLSSTGNPRAYSPPPQLRSQILRSPSLSPTTGLSPRGVAQYPRGNIILPPPQKQQQPQQLPTFHQQLYEDQPKVLPRRSSLNSRRKVTTNHLSYISSGYVDTRSRSGSCSSLEIKPVVNSEIDVSAPIFFLSEANTFRKQTKRLFGKFSRKNLNQVAWQKVILSQFGHNKNP